jgi:hypothetical protein
MVVVQDARHVGTRGFQRSQGAGQQVPRDPAAGRPSGRQVQRLQTAIADLEAFSAWIIDEDDGSDPIGPKTRRCGFAANLGWLPT